MSLWVTGSETFREQALQRLGKTGMELSFFSFHFLDNLFTPSHLKDLIGQIQWQSMGASDERWKGPGGMMGSSQPLVWSLGCRGHLGGNSGTSCLFWVLDSGQFRVQLESLWGGKSSAVPSDDFPHWNLEGDWYTRAAHWVFRQRWERKIASFHLIFQFSHCHHLRSNWDFGRMTALPGLQIFGSLPQFTYRIKNVYSQRWIIQGLV